VSAIQAGKVPSEYTAVHIAFVQAKIVILKSITLGNVTLLLQYLSIDLPGPPGGAQIVNSTQRRFKNRSLTVLNVDSKINLK